MKDDDFDALLNKLKSKKPQVWADENDPCPSFDPKSYDPDLLRRERLAPFKHLWKIDDSEWMAQREKDWEVLSECFFSEAMADELKENKAYFLYGIYPEYIPEETVFLLTPITSSKEAKDFFMSDNFSATSRQNIMSGFLRFTYPADRLKWYRHHIKCLCEGILGHEYQMLEQFEGTREEEYSPEPTVWCQNFSSHSIQILNAEIAFTGIIYLVEYFVSALPYAVKPKARKRTKLQQMFRVVDEVLANKDAPEIAKEFAQELKSHEEEINANWALNAHLDS